MAMNDLAMKAMAPEGGDMAAKKGGTSQIVSKYLKGNVEIIEPKAKKKLKGEGEQYEDFMNNLSEGTWSIPDTHEQIDALEKAFAEPINPVQKAKMLQVQCTVLLVMMNCLMT